MDICVSSLGSRLLRNRHGWMHLAFAHEEPDFLASAHSALLSAEYSVQRLCFSSRWVSFGNTQRRDFAQVRIDFNFLIHGVSVTQIMLLSSELCRFNVFLMPAIFFILAMILLFSFFILVAGTSSCCHTLHGGLLLLITPYRTYRNKPCHVQSMSITMMEG